MILFLSLLFCQKFFVFFWYSIPIICNKAILGVLQNECWWVAKSSLSSRHKNLSKMLTTNNKIWTKMQANFKNLGYLSWSKTCYVCFIFRFFREQLKTYFLEIRTKKWVVISCGYKKWVPTLRSFGTKFAQSVLLLFFNARSLSLLQHTTPISPSLFTYWLKFLCIIYYGQKCWLTKALAFTHRTVALSLVLLLASARTSFWLSIL